jgi:hypothetical protein
VPNDIPDWTAQAKVNIVGGVSGLNLGDVGGPVLVPDSGSETVNTSGGPIINAVGVLASFKAAAASVIAKVGAFGSLAVGSNTSVSPAFGQATVAGHLLVAWVTASQAIPTTAAAGWAQVVQAASDARADVAIWAKPNCGSGEAAPVFTAAGGTAPMVAQLGEFSGVATASPTDQTASGATASSTLSLTAAAIDAAFGDLVLLATCWLWTSSATATFSDTLNNGAAAVNAGNSGGLAAVRGSSFVFGIVPAATVPQPLGVATWPYDVTGNSAPAVGVTATVTLAASPGKTYTAALIAGGAVQNGVTVAIASLTLLDGAVVKFQAQIGVVAGQGTTSPPTQIPTAYKGTAGNLMTLQLTSVGATAFGYVNLGAYLR